MYCTKIKVIFLPPTYKDYSATRVCWKFCFGVYSKLKIINLWRSQSTMYNEDPESGQTEDNHLTKQACYLLPTLEWESGLQRWRAKPLSPGSRAGKTICLCTLFTECNPFSVSWSFKIQSTAWLYQSFKKFWLQVEGFHQIDVSHLWRLPLFKTEDIFIWSALMAQNQHCPWAQISSSFLPWNIHTNTAFNAK